MKLTIHLQAHWSRLAGREKIGVLLAVTLVTLGFFWWVLLAPALHTWRHSQAQQRSLDAQLQTMQALRAQAQLLQAQPRLAHDDALRLLQASVKQHLGASAQLSVSGERASVTLKATAGEALAQWLAHSRSSGHVLPTEARLVRSPANSMNWDGLIVLVLPAR